MPTYRASPRVGHLYLASIFFFGKSRKNSLQQFGIQLDKFRNLANLTPSTRKYTRSERTWHRGLQAYPRLSAPAKPVGHLLLRAGRNFNWSPHTRQIIIDATVLSARVHGISRSADSGVHRYVGQLTILVGQLTIAIVIQRHDSWPTVDPHAGRDSRLVAGDYAGTHSSGGAREAGRDFARQTGEVRKKILVGLLFTFSKFKIANYWRWALFLLGI